MTARQAISVSPVGKVGDLMKVLKCLVVCELVMRDRADVEVG